MTDHDYRRELLATHLERLPATQHTAALGMLLRENCRVFINPETGTFNGLAGIVRSLPPGPLVELTADDLPEQYHPVVPDTPAELMGDE